MKIGAGGNWRRFDEKFNASIIRQTELSCFSAVGAMLLRNRGVNISQEIIRDIIGVPSFIGNLAWALNRFDISDDGLEWRGFPTTNESLEVLLRHHKNWGVVLINDYRDRIGHAVFIDGRTKNGLIKIKDPFDQTSYKMTMADFLSHWGGEVIVRWIPDTK